MRSLDAHVYLSHSQPQLREARGEAARGAEGIKRLRLLLASAREALREKGVAFMEEDSGEGACACACQWGPYTRVYGCDAGMRVDASMCAGAACRVQSGSSGWQTVLFVRMNA